MEDYKPLSISYNELETTDWPEDVLIGGGLLSRGDRMMIGAESKGGKSTFVNDLNRECLMGGSFLGFNVTRPLKILYCQAELRERRLKERLIPNLGHIAPEFKSNFFIWNTRNQILINEPESFEKIRQELLYRKPDIWEIDPMLNFHSYDENSAPHMAMFFRDVDKLKDEADCAVVMPHHFRKKNDMAGGSLLEQIRGSSAIRGWADTTIALEGRTTSEYRALEFECRNSDEPIRRIIRYNPVTKGFDWHDPISEISEWLQVNYTNQELSTKDFVKLITEQFGHRFSSNRTKAFELKNVLLSTKVVSERISGKSHLIRLTKKDPKN